ncbi:MAG TPA: hypothetical protein PK622_05400 [Saprospiraceae bacterium]|nr:hypothetical protein [Saprospiraceae bacterium]
MSVQDYQGNIHNSDESIERFSQPLNVGYWLKSNDEYISNNVKLRLPDIPFYQSRFWHYWKKTKSIQESIEIPDSQHVTSLFVENIEEFPEEIKSSSTDTLESFTEIIDPNFRFDIVPNMDPIIITEKADNIPHQIDNDLADKKNVQNPETTESSDDTTEISNTQIIHSEKEEDIIINLEENSQSFSHNSDSEELEIDIPLVDEQSTESQTPMKNIKSSNENPDFYHWLLELKASGLTGIQQAKPTISAEIAPVEKKKTDKKPKDDIRLVIESSNILGEEVISETLAELYVSQGFKEKAAEMYRKLSLKYPEKHSIFAALIENLKK